MKRLWQRYIIGLGIFLGLLFLMMALFQMTASDPVAEAKAQSGASSVAGFESSNHIFGGYAKVQLQREGQPGKTITIELRRPFWSPKWAVVSEKE